MSVLCFLIDFMFEKVKIKWEVEAKLYGINPIKLFTNIYINNAYKKGKYTCPLLGFIWFITIYIIIINH